VNGLAWAGTAGYIGRVPRSPLQETRSMARPLVLTLALVTAAAAWPGDPARADGAMRTVTGSLSYPERMALPDDAELVLEFLGRDGAVIAEERRRTDGAQVPLPFSLWVPAETAGAFAGAIRVEDLPAWASEPVTIERGTGPADLGTVSLERVAPLGYTSRLDCVGTEIEIGFLDERARMRVGQRIIDLVQVPAASGARYEAESDPGTWFWGKGLTATVSLGGTTLPECIVVEDSTLGVGTEEPAAPGEEPMQAGGADDTQEPGGEAPVAEGPSLRAAGNEPSWAVTIEGGVLRLALGLDAAPIEAPAPEPESVDGATVYRLPDEGVTITARERLCVDPMSGMPFPLSVEAETPEGTFQACGGEPRSLLEGPEWRVASIGDTAVEEEVTLAFLPDDRVAGRSGCNRFTGGYTLTGESLRFGPLASTMMACPEPQMALERQFLDTLEQVSLFAIGDDGALVLLINEQPAMVARR
jgi:heat shock protein HslJ